MASSEGITKIVNAAYSERAAKGVDANGMINGRFFFVFSVMSPP